MRVDRLVDAFVARLAATDARTEDAGRLAAEVDRIGEREVIATTQICGRLLDRRLRAANEPAAFRAAVAHNLAELRDIVEDLDLGAGAQSAADSRRRFGIVPRGDPAAAQLERYARAQGRIQAVLAALEDQRAELVQEGAEIEQERRSLEAEMDALRGYTYLVSRLEAAVEHHVAEIRSADPERARSVRADLVVAIVQRRHHLLSQLAVATQASAALGVAHESNREVARAIRAATTTTIAALRTSVAVSQATRTRRRIETRFRAARQRPTSSGTTGRPAAPDALGASTEAAAEAVAARQAWAEVIAALDRIDRYAVEAAASIWTAARELEVSVERSRRPDDPSAPRETASGADEAGDPSAHRAERPHAGPGSG